MKYSNPPLKNVFCRIDYSNIKIADNINELVDKYSEEYKFTIENKESTTSFIYNEKTGEIRKEDKLLINYILKSIDGNRIIKISEDNCVIHYIKYNGHDELIKDIQILSDLIRIYKIETIKRAGLRYINKLSIKEFCNSINDFKNYLNDDLLSFDLFLKDEKISRAMSQIFIKRDEFDISFKYGFWNPDFPSEIINWEYLLDFDAYSSLPISTEGLDIEKLFLSYHNSISILFEKSIKDTFREIIK